MENGPVIRVLIADDHQVVRQGLITFLGLQPGIVVVGEACDGYEALELIARLTPDVVLMDLVMPGLDGISATRQITSSGIQTKVIALTSFADDDQVLPAIRAGAASYLLKDVTPEDLVEAIVAVHRGEPRLHPKVARRLMDQVGLEKSVSTMSNTFTLTGREMDVVRLVAEGRNNHQIATELVISEKTVKSHMSSILGKLGLEDRTQLAILALKQGWTKEE